MLPTLPVTEALPALTEALRAGPNAVLIAPPGAGKTTLVPLALMAEPWAEGRKLLVLEPRRVAARAAARRMAELLGEGAPGRTIGLATRLDRAGSAATRVEVVTEGLLVRRLQSDPGLEGVAAVLFDEAHERNLDTDLALALCLDLQSALRPELRLLAMSATLDGAAFAGLLGGAPTIESLGRAFPVTVTHRPRDLADPRDLPEAMAGTIRAALREHPGDVLAFLPGWGEIRRTAERLSGIEAEVLPLHGELPPAEQDRALSPSDRRKVVLATSIAETSLTVPGVRIVVDGGFRRAPRLDPATGLSRLVTVRISKAAAEQRAGRAGRTAPGVAIRLWSEALHRGLAPADRPEILESELSGLALDLAAWGAEPGGLAWLDPPPGGAMASARALLRDLDALDAEGRVTAMGRRMARLGTHPRLARMLAAAEGEGEKALAADLAALLEERDPIRGREAPSDIGMRLDLLHGADHAAADRATVHRIRRAAALHRRRLGVHGNTYPEGDPGALLAAGFPDRIAAMRGVMAGAFRLASGQGARLPATDPLSKSPLLAVADLELQGTEARIRMAAPLDRTVLEARFPERFVREEAAAFDARSGAVQARRRLRFGPLVLEEQPLPQADPAAIAAALAAAVAERGLRDLPWGDTARQVQARIGWMRQTEGEDWPDLSDAALIAGVQEWLAPHLHGRSRLAELSTLNLPDLLLSALDWPQRQRLDAALPARLPLPASRSAAIDYAREVPTLEARAQHLYGMAALPRLAEGRVPLQVALLSPAGRPIAVTGDLAGFWKGGWLDARKDMRGRYPKHNWPEDPANAQADPPKK
ncbi:ATP-dependent helicase HrpB [Siccirubricoccus sp. KC 17139]|uniref:RNA helicase n=1 Tax=Siccirubricoccus soli TaxID=2899147 RepID=A0ABT1D0E7_9PROT|nr:ATP-dependent helicase HrpB [Siccirubricoccus soli]MCO6415385.1 ATP-dependent helicase HrpB [Siccirubricoccus soli]MCP2681517.1 ATP-dependent helicase HrpB [Siccirubricoccus soli]